MSEFGALYDRIGAGYARSRQPDPRIGARLLAALDGCNTVVSVGAGSGSYEPAGRTLVAVDPSRAMLEQRPAGSAPALVARAERLPLKSDCADAAQAILTLHHWSDWPRGLREMHRVARRRVLLLTWDPDHAGFWLVQDYFPEIVQIDRHLFPTLRDIERAAGAARTITVPIPADCTDGFLGAYWRRPTAYLDPAVRGAMSTFQKIPALGAGLARLASDLDSGHWHERHSHLADMNELDLGYRLLVWDRH